MGYEFAIRKGIFWYRRMIVLTLKNIIELPILILALAFVLFIGINVLISVIKNKLKKEMTNEDKKIY